MSTQILWTVVVPGKKRSARRHVTAHYYKIEGGVLTFRDVSPNGGFPIVKHVFAAGQWLEIIGTQY